jgi:hypothetical protein
MSYGMDGDLAKSRPYFARAIAVDPDYPLYYYNLACPCWREEVNQCAEPRNGRPVAPTSIIIKEKSGHGGHHGEAKTPPSTGIRTTSELKPR